MEAKELMIGDWVLYCGIPIKIEQIIPTTGGADMQPIPLTPDILEKNGFDKTKTNSYVIQKDEKLFLLSTDKSRLFTVLSSNVVFINYIHELQHALRLCGLSELAYNFKVE